ncbi:hypothetical protein L1887_20823 [Cichorium endivia]|nr:hypothetical protein L1887_20823 [Cichorium endivia]
MPQAAIVLHLCSSLMSPTLSGPKPMISMCNYTTSSNSPRYAMSSGNRFRICQYSIERATVLPDRACVVFKESRSGSSLALFRNSPTSSDKEFMISAKKSKDVGGCDADKWLPASQVKPKRLDRVETTSLDDSPNPPPVLSGNRDLLKIPGVGPKNLTKLVENNIAGVTDLQKMYKDKFSRKPNQKMVDFLLSTIGISNKKHAKSITTFVKKSVSKEIKDGDVLNSGAIPPAPKKNVK